MLKLNKKVLVTRVLVLLAIAFLPIGLVYSKATNLKKSKNVVKTSKKIKHTASKRSISENHANSTSKIKNANVKKHSEAVVSAATLPTEKSDVSNNEIGAANAPSGGGVYITPKVIRVLIDEKNTNKSQTLTIKAKESFVLESPGGSKVTALFNDKNVDVIAKNGKLYLRCSDKKFRHIRYDDLEVYASHGNLELNGKSYQGSVNIRIDPLTWNVLIVNRIDLDDYIYSVLKSESVPTWPLEMQKVQAIASRSYALHHMKQVRLKNPRSFYDIRNTRQNQVYDGVHAFKHLRDAVDQTRGVILTYKGDIVLAMFDICCGGIIPSKMRKNKKCMPYLRRDKPCNFCKNTAFYRSQLVYKKEHLLNIAKASPNLKKRFEGFGNKLNDIQITDRDAAGVVQKVRFAGRKYVNLSGLEVLALFGDKVKSCSFSIKQDGDKLIFAFKGWGHFNGLCQWGARSLVSQGWDYRKILSFYYPGTNLSRLK